MGSVSSYPIFVKPLDAVNNTQPNTAFNYVWNFTTDSSCSNVLLSKSSTITTLTDGTGFVDIDTSSISTPPSYICEYRDGSLKHATQISDQFFNNLFANNLVANGSLLTGLLGSQLTNTYNWLNKTDNDLLYYSISNPFSFYNSTDFVISDYATNIKVDSLGNWSQDSSNYYTSIQVDALSLSNFNNDLGIGNWTLDKTNYYTSSQTDTEISNANTSMKNYADNKFVTNSGGDNLTGQYNYNGGWTSNGLSIIDGDLYAQTVYAYNFSGLNVTNLNTNGSLYPTLDNQFDLGNQTFRWRNLNLGNDAYIGGKVGIGTTNPTEKLEVNGFAKYQTPFGGFSIDEDSDGILSSLLTTANQNYNITNINISSVQVGNTTYFTPVQSTGEITFSTLGEGYYSVFMGGSWSSNKVSVVHCAVYKNYNTKTQISLERKISNANDVGNANAKNYVYVTNGDILNIQCSSDTSSTTISINHLDFTVERVSI